MAEEVKSSLMSTVLEPISLEHELISDITQLGLKKDITTDESLASNMYNKFVVVCTYSKIYLLIVKSTNKLAAYEVTSSLEPSCI